MSIESLLTIEDALWHEGAAAYERHLSNQALVVVPGAALDKPQTVAAIAAAERWSAMTRHDLRTVQVAADGVLVHYRAEATRGEELPYEALVSSLYRAEAGEWRLVFHQQTPLTT